MGAGVDSRGFRLKPRALAKFLPKGCVLVTKRRILAVVAAVAMAFTVAACSDVKQVGAAYTAGTYRMSEQQLTDLVKECQDAEKKLGVQASVVADVTSGAINAHIWESIISTAAVAKKVTVTDSEVTQILVTQYNKSGKTAVQGQLAANGFPPRIVNDYARMVLLQSKISNAVAGGQTGAAAQGVVGAFWTKTAADMKITVAPRYGTWDETSLQVKPPVNPNVSPAK